MYHGGEINLEEMVKSKDQQLNLCKIYKKQFRAGLMAYVKPKESLTNAGKRAIV